MDARLIINVVDNLESDSATDALSAGQGKVLKGLIDTLAETVEDLDISVEVDSGWKNITLLNGAVAFSEAQKPQYRKIGNKVYVRGVFKGVTTLPVIIGTLPAGYRPTAQVIFMNSGTGNRVDRFEIKANGDINYASASEAPLEESWHALHTTFLND